MGCSIPRSQKRVHHHPVLENQKGLFLVGMWEIHHSQSVHNGKSVGSVQVVERVCRCSRRCDSVEWGLGLVSSGMDVRMLVMGWRMTKGMLIYGSRRDIVNPMSHQDAVVCSCSGMCACADMITKGTWIIMGGVANTVNLAQGTLLGCSYKRTVKFIQVYV